MNEFKFTKGVEKLINPINVGTLHFLQSFNEKLPTGLQKKLIKKSSKKNPLMGFVVEPYSYFICYEIKDVQGIQKLLPNGFEVVKTKIFDNDVEKYYFILCCFSARTSAFFGNRLEAYVIAKNIETGLTSWVIIDYDTNTISYDTKNGLTKPNCDTGIITTNFSGELIVNMQSNDGTNKLIFNSDITKGEMKKLDEKLWVEGNLSVAYGSKLSNDGDVFSLKFDPGEMEKALDINIEDINIEQNTWYNQYLEDTPSNLVCFPYAQHFVSDAPGYSSNIKSKEELVEKINKIKFEDIEVYSTGSFSKIIMIMPVVFIVTILVLLVIIIGLI